MKPLEAFQHGDGAHWGLSDWYEEGEAQLTAALADHAPFDTGWYSSKKEIASARIRSEDGIKIKVEVSVSDDFDTEGRGYASTTDWRLDVVRHLIEFAWRKAEKDRNETQEYEGFRIGRDGRWEETFLINIGWADAVFPPVTTTTGGGGNMMRRKTTRAYPTQTSLPKLCKRSRSGRMTLPSELRTSSP